MFKPKSSTIIKVNSVFLLMIFILNFLTLNGCVGVAQSAPVCVFLESVPENVCFKSENPAVIIYSGNSGIFGKFESNEAIQYFKMESTMGGEVDLGIENNFILIDCPYFDDNIIKFEIWENHIGKFFPSDVTTLEFKRHTLTEAETVQIKEEYKTWKRETNLYSPKTPAEALAKFGPNGHQLVSRAEPKEFELMNPCEVLDDLKNEVYIELPYDTVFEDKDKTELINYVYVPHKEYCESYISYNCLTTYFNEKDGETVYAHLENSAVIFGYSYKWDELVKTPDDYPVDDKYIKEIKSIIKPKNLKNGLLFLTTHPSLTDDSSHTITAFIAKDEDTDKYIFILNGITNNRTFKHGKIVEYNKSQGYYLTENSNN